MKDFVAALVPLAIRGVRADGLMAKVLAFCEANLDEIDPMTLEKLLFYLKSGD